MIKSLPAVLIGSLLAAAILIRAAIAQESGTAGDAGDDSVAKAGIYSSVIRFITDDDYPPFNYRDEDGTLTGFNIDIARAICLELDVTCDIQSRGWETLLPALSNGDADAIAASIAISPSILLRADFTDRYYHTPARFTARRGFEKLEISPEGLEGRTVGVIKGSSHEAYIDAFFRDCIVERFETNADARRALMIGKIDLLFDDTISSVFWINGTLSRSCCEFRGGSFAEPRYFGEGVGFAVRKGNRELIDLLNGGLKKIRASGRFEELMLRYFPLKIN